MRRVLRSAAGLKRPGQSAWVQRRHVQPCCRHRRLRPHVCYSRNVQRTAAQHLQGRRQRSAGQHSPRSWARAPDWARGDPGPEASADGSLQTTSRSGDMQRLAARQEARVPAGTLLAPKPELDISANGCASKIMWFAEKRGATCGAKEEHATFEWL